MSGAFGVLQHSGRGIRDSSFLRLGGRTEWGRRQHRGPESDVMQNIGQIASSRASVSGCFATSRINALA